MKFFGADINRELVAAASVGALLGSIAGLVSGWTLAEIWESPYTAIVFLFDSRRVP